MKYVNRPNGFREKNVLRKRIIPDIVGFKDMENILENNGELKNTVNNVDNNDPRLK